MPRGIRLAHETIFYHRPSKTLIITNIAFNFDQSKSFETRLAARIIGSYNVLRPTPLEKWGTRDKSAVEASMRHALDWDFERVIPGHGSIVEAGGKEQCRI